MIAKSFIIRTSAPTKSEITGGTIDGVPVKLTAAIRSVPQVNPPSLEPQPDPRWTLQLPQIVTAAAFDMANDRVNWVQLRLIQDQDEIGTDYVRDFTSMIIAHK